MAGNKRWSDKDLDILRREYGWTDLEALAAKLGRSVAAIQWKASKEGIAFTREINVLEYKSIKQNLKDLSDAMTDVQAKLNKIINHLGLVDTEPDYVDAVIIEKYKNHSAEEIGKMLNIDRKKVYDRVVILEKKGLMERKNIPGEYDEIILEMYENNSLKEIAKAINKPYYHVLYRLKKMREFGIDIPYKRPSRNSK